MSKVDNLFSKAERLKSDYERHFNTSFPERITGWWNPLNIALYPDELEKGVEKMSRDIEKAIKTNTPIEEIPEELYKGIIF